LRHGGEQLICQDRFLEERDNTERFGEVLEIVSRTNEYHRGIGDGRISLSACTNSKPFMKGISMLARIRPPGLPGRGIAKKAMS
jgi:hypothetical protein